MKINTGRWWNLLSSVWNFNLFLNAQSILAAHFWFMLSMLGLCCALYLSHIMDLEAEELEEESE